jgi:hypothetical protein
MRVVKSRREVGSMRIILGPRSSVSRSEHGYFAPGTSANPGGRPAIDKEVVKLARANSLDCIRALIEIRDDQGAPPGVRAFCANSILDRAIGKVREFVEGDPERIELVEAMMTALRAGIVRTTRRTLTYEGDSDER